MKVEASIVTSVADDTRSSTRIPPGAIILLHDGNIPAEKLLATVKSSLDTLRQLGYEMVRLDELLK